MTYDEDEEYPRPPRKVRKTEPASAARSKWIPWAIGIGLFLGIGCCSGTLGVVYLGWQLVEDELLVQLRDNPKIREHLGELKSLDLDVSKSLATKEDVSVFAAVGTTGTGELTVTHETDNAGDEQILDAKLRLPDGQVIQVVP
jgi:hypothetical protein